MKWTWIHVDAGLIPLITRIMLVHSIITICAATMIVKIIAGRTTTGIVTFDSTVVRSETGSDFQKRRLRSLRSLCSASRQ